MRASHFKHLARVKPITLAFTSPSFYGNPGGRIRFNKQSLLGYMAHHHLENRRKDFTFQLSLPRKEIDDAGNLSKDSQDVIDYLKRQQFIVKKPVKSSVKQFVGYTQNRESQNTIDTSIPFRTCELAVVDYFNKAFQREKPFINHPQFAIQNVDYPMQLTHHYVNINGMSVDVEVTEDSDFDIPLFEQINNTEGFKVDKFWHNEYEPWKVAYYYNEQEKENEVVK
jgi:hypothetical protein